MVEQTFIEADLRRSGPSSKRTFVEVHFCQVLLIAYNKLVETELRPFSPPPA